MRGVGEDGSGDREALALASGELDAALADDGVVGLGKAFGKLVDARDAAGVEELLFGRVGVGEHHILANGAVEEEGLLQHDAKLPAIAVEPDRREVDAVDGDQARVRRMEAADEGDDGGLARTGRADQSGDRSGLRLEGDAVEHGLVGFVGEVDIVEAHVAADFFERHGAGGVGELVVLAEDLHGAVKAGERLGELGADIDHLKDRRDHKGQQHGVLHIAAGVRRAAP